MENKKEEDEKNDSKESPHFFNAPQIQIPDEEYEQEATPNDYQYRNYNSNSLETPMSSEKFGEGCLSKSLLKRMEETTPITDKNIASLGYNFEGLNITDELNAAASTTPLNFIPKGQPLQTPIYKKEESGDFLGKNEKNTILNEEKKEEKKELKPEEYLFEKFGKRGWCCKFCDNFNFESRTKCNRCQANKEPKSLVQIKIENEQNKKDNPKKPLVERQGDWACPQCKNLNFAFRTSCNRCGAPKQNNAGINQPNDIYPTEYKQMNKEGLPYGKLNKYSNYGAYNDYNKGYYYGMKNRPNYANYPINYPKEMQQNNNNNNAYRPKYYGNPNNTNNRQRVFNNYGNCNYITNITISNASNYYPPNMQPGVKKDN